MKLITAAANAVMAFFAAVFGGAVIGFVISGILSAIYGGHSDPAFNSGLGTIVVVYISVAVGAALGIVAALVVFIKTLSDGPDQAEEPPSDDSP